ncbi:unnamed protein product [Callosobruchus maculatus]|uniref:Uncharacterized protein n=1 Tax=Callosobruchus maculatus TaxID=64391 RepID=A0A653CS52_CALMS|nr:unnamed protein product [Callosobruchus maculatus]
MAVVTFNKQCQNAEPHYERGDHYTALSLSRSKLPQLSLRSSRRDKISQTNAETEKNRNRTRPVLRTKKSKIKCRFCVKYLN